MTAPATQAKLVARLNAVCADPRLLDRCCSVVALRLAAEFGDHGTQIFGYFSSENDSSVVGKSSGGHDFCVVADRYLADPWASEIEGLPVPHVIDMKRSRGLVSAWYGRRDSWSATDPGAYPLCYLAKAFADGRWGPYPW